MNIVIIEDEPIIRNELKILLENALYEVTLIESFDHAADCVLQTRADLILLDLNLPGISGLDICTQIREKSEIPIIFLTSRTSSMDELTGMLKGGDDYITKPYQAPLLLARIAAVLKRTNPSASNEVSILKVKEVELNLARGCICYKEKKAELTKNELKILHYLFLHAGEIVSRLDLVEYLWDNQVFIDDNTLSVNVTRIRGKLKLIGIEDFIETKRGMGYRI
ncbi:response regulator [Hespellia stercorisuis]|uniref:Stage 0 sporulation protein A homolog n=1 Tax=Hespellia stercorisuis DSM 15480 TaxID=1121950 RepID=A0A1M6WEQ2_9FIRM|nr:response regulator transcription factor [Hespellia stercorisuis]SHK92283.1 DNA-binding response regulator, OmpR family, contains REC and winged-helix (wHTH) domain [Hespellia stercorisuis DSM 15480]